MAFNQANAETAAQGAARNLRARGGGEDVIARAYLGGEDDGRPIGGILTPAQHTLRIQDALQPLAEAGVVIGQFTYQQVVACGYSPDSFIKLVRTLTGHNDDAILKSCLSLGVKRDLYDLPSDITVATLIKLCNYLRSPPGQAALQDKQRTLKLAKKGKGVLPPRDVAMTSVLQIQLQDLANRVKQQRAKDDAELAAIRERYALKEREREANTLRIKKSVSPAYRWVEPSNNDINTKSYDLYAQWCETNGYQALPPGPDGWAVAVKQFGEQVKAEIMAEFCADEKRQRKLTKYLKAKILELDEKGDRDSLAYTEITWLTLVEKRFWRMPLPQRILLSRLIPVGMPMKPGVTGKNRMLSQMLSPDVLERKEQHGVTVSNALRATSLSTLGAGGNVKLQGRLRMVRTWQGEPRRGIPVSRSGWEVGLRKVIGGGELRNWAQDSNMFRGGGTSDDAFLLLSQARIDIPGSFLTDTWTLVSARRALSLPSGLVVPDGPSAVVMKRFNNEATAGPFFRSFGIKTKYGMKRELESFAWSVYDAYACGNIDARGLPHFCARLGFRTKLVTKQKALQSVEDCAPIGRAVMMLDALEQPFSSPLYNVMSKYTGRKRLEKGCGFKNAVVKASSDWGRLWEEVREAKCVIELDWSKFDRERPSQDIAFVIDVILSCFTPRNEREGRLLEAYGVCMQRALIERLIIMDSGGIFGIEGMVPSGSLWTGWLDTALNILYMKAACVQCDFPLSMVSVFCAGDDNLTLLSFDPGDEAYHLRDVLNQEYRAGIKEGDFFVHMPPFHVTQRQAWFPLDVDLSKGTSMHMDKAIWREFDGVVYVDHALGRSHRWEYVFRGKPKFLSNYWLPDGRPIRPAHDNLEKLLFPEGIHDSMDKYASAVIAMVVDNPFNHHNCNHMMMRYVILRQIQRAGRPLNDFDLCLYLCKFRPEAGIGCPYPMVAQWRRSNPHGRMEDYREVDQYVEEFRDFMQQVSTLYLRRQSGGVDSWKFMDIIRGEGYLGEGQFGNDIRRWMSWLHSHPATKSFKPTGRQEESGEKKHMDTETRGKVRRALTALCDKLELGTIDSVETFACWTSDRLIRYNHHVNSDVSL
ncbi:TPA_asm: fusion protein [Rhodiola rosea amalgavirus 1]|nr:TPA_asm: fusion protein [Rhodiola rosea amalgavirus 1]